MNPPLRVFISYTAEDLAPFADIVVDIVQRLEWTPVDHRKWMPTGRPSVPQCREKVESADILVVLVAHRYGWTPTIDEGGDGHTSITWLEVKWAWELDKEVVPYLVQPDASWRMDQVEGHGNQLVLDRLNAFKDELKRRHAGFFSGDPASLRHSLEGALRDAGNRIRERAAEQANSISVAERTLSPQSSGVDGSKPAKMIRVVLPAHAGAEPLTFTLTPALLSGGGLNIEILTEGELQHRQPTQQTEQAVEVAGDDVLAIESTDGSHRFMSAEDLRDRIQTGRDRPGAWAGFRTQALKALRVLRVDDDEPFEQRGARGVTADIEKSTLPKPGVYGFADPSVSGSPLPAKRRKVNQPLLLFLHGPALGNAETFRGLRQHAMWSQLAERYGERLLAFEHHTISVSPIANALDLARWLPVGATLHIISHSRGGLIGELLCMPRRLLENEHELLARLRSSASSAGTKAHRDALEEDIENLRALADIIREKRWRVERFLRVACPARGLVAVDLGTYLSILMNLVRPEGGTERSPLLSRLTISAVKHRLTFEDLPGLEAMRAPSPLIALINNPRWVSDAELTVVGGDVSETSQGRRLTALFSDSFFFSDAGDLVVPSASILGGWKRHGPVSHWPEGRKSSHYRYFDDDALCRRVVAWLTSIAPDRREITSR